MPYYFKERASAGDAEARRRLSGFGPAPQE